MRDAESTPSWSNKFKRQIALIGGIGISPAMTFLSRTSDVPRVIVLSVAVFGFLFFAAYIWYFFFVNPPSKSEAPMSERETWICGVALTLVVTLIVFNVYKSFS